MALREKAKPPSNTMCQPRYYRVPMPSHPSLTRLVVFLFAIVFGFSQLDRAEAQGKRPDGSVNRAEWMAKGSFGIMVHYLLRGEGNSPEERTAGMNRQAEQFDLEFFMKQFDASGADWLILTLGQTSGYLCSPHPVVDEKNPGHTPRRDILMEVAQQLHQRGKRLIVYFPSDFDADPCVKAALAHGTPGFAERYFEFLRYYSVKFGPLISGWWFDTCMQHPDEHWAKWETALRAGNPDTVIAFSGAEFCTGRPLQSLTERVDYFAGEIHLLEDGKIRRDFLSPGSNILTTPDGKLRKEGQEPQFYMPAGPFIGNAQLQCLLPIDLTFNPAIPNAAVRYSDETLIKFVKDIRAVGGAVTINLPITFENGHIPADSHAQIVRISKALGFVKE